MVTSYARLRAAFALLAALTALLACASNAAAHDYGPCTLDLTPNYDANPLGAPHTFTAYVTIRGGNQYVTAGAMCAAGGGGPAVGKTVTFTVTSGPNAGYTTTAVTGADGKASFTYTSALTGLDVVQAKVSEASCLTQLDYDSQTLGDCPSGQIFTLIVSDTAKKQWYEPYDPYYCGSYGGVCASAIPGGPHRVKKHVRFGLKKRCIYGNFRVRPNYRGGTILWTKLKAGKTRTRRLAHAPFRFRIPIGRFAPGRLQRLTLTTLFTDGEVVVVRRTFRRCA
jgi:hypothetical protein